MINLSEVSPNTITGKIIRLPLCLIPRNAVVPILRGPLRGQKWITGSSLHRCWLGSYELDFQRVLANEVKPGGVFYDVGANVGFYSLLAANLIFPGRVFAFEPVSENISYLHRHLTINRVKNVEVFQMAISDKRGEECFSVESTRSMGHLSDAGGTTVCTDTLDRIIKERLIPPPNYIKMDIEGSEVRALTGAQECFLRVKPILFLATHGKKIHEDCCALLREWKYQTTIISKLDDDRAELVSRPPI